MKVFYAYKFYFIVSDEYKKDVEDLYRYVKIRSEQYGYLSEYIEVKSRKDFSRAISLIEKESKKGKLPYLHIEAHGSTKGIKLISDATVHWRELIDDFTKINIACRNNLVVSIASCWGGSFIDTLSEKVGNFHKARAPVYAFIGPRKDITYNELRYFEEYFNTLICEKDLFKAYTQLIDNTKDDFQFKVVTTENLYHQLLDIYIKYIVLPKFKSSNSYLKYADSILNDFFKMTGRAITAPELAELYNITTNEKHLVDMLNGFTDRFFMIDLYKENALRFDKIDRINNWDNMIAHMLKN